MSRPSISSIDAALLSIKASIILEPVAAHLQRPSTERSVLLDVSLVRVLIALLLLVAVGLKIDELATQPLLDARWLDGRAGITAGVAIELCLASWLLSGLWEWLARGVTAGCFALFSVISASKLFGGASSCGCFGNLHVHPSYTFALDLMILAGLLASLFVAKGRPGHASRRSTIIAAAFLFIAGLSAVSAADVRFYRMSKTTARDQWPPHSLVVLEPEKWVGQPFPLTQYIDVGVRLSSGRWKVVLYHDDCSSCQAAVPRFEQMDRVGAKELNGARVALIEMPEYAAPGEGLVPKDSLCLHGRLREDHDWFAQTPLVVDLEDGIVTHAASGD